MRRHRQEVAMLADISLTPLIDTALTLLIIFMIATPMMQNAIRVTLPKGSAQEVGTTQQELVIYIDAQGVYFFNGKQLGLPEVIDALKKAVVDQKEQTVFVKADEGSSYGSVIELVDKIKVVGGVKHVALATTKRT